MYSICWTSILPGQQSTDYAIRRFRFFGVSQALLRAVYTYPNAQSLVTLFDMQIRSLTIRSSLFEEYGIVTAPDKGAA